jgi:hypothetical protein
MASSWSRQMTGTSPAATVQIADRSEAGRKGSPIRVTQRSPNGEPRSGRRPARLVHRPARLGPPPVLSIGAALCPAGAAVVAVAAAYSHLALITVPVAEAGLVRAKPPRRPS